MENKVKVLVVEDDMIIAANISLQLTNLGFEVTGIETRGEEAILHVQENNPDIILMDIHLKGKLDGIATATHINSILNIPIIYLTANTDEASFNRAKKTHPFAFIPKPLNIIQLRRTFELVVQQIDLKGGKTQIENSALKVLEDRIFIRHKGNMVKLLLADILYIEADRNYCKIVSASSTYLLATTLKTMEGRLPRHGFLRVHRSYMVNITKLDVVAEGHLEIDRKVIPIAKMHRGALLSRLQTI